MDRYTISSNVGRSWADGLGIGSDFMIFLLSDAFALHDIPVIRLFLPCISMDPDRIYMQNRCKIYDTPEWETAPSLWEYEKGKGKVY